MSLQANLEKFKKQQEKCQSTLSTIAAKQASSRTSVPHRSSTTLQKAAPPRASAANIRPHASAVKFSNDTERLQMINTIRKAPTGAQMKRVIELLEKTREAFTVDEINDACYVDMKANKEVFESLSSNVKVNYDGKYFSYKSKYDVKNKDQLLLTIRKYPEGIAIIDLKDSYLDVMQDLQAEGHIWLLSNFDSKEDLAYPNDPRCSSMKVDDDLKQLFRSIELPLDMLEIEKDLRQNRMKPATDTAKRRAAAQIQGGSSSAKPKKKKQEITKRTKLTNSHLPELFQRL